MKKDIVLPRLNFICAPENSAFCTPCDKAAFYCVFNKTLSEKPKKITAYITAIGVFTAYINGKRVSDEYFAPGWTSEKRLMVCRYDVTDFFNCESNYENNKIGDLSGETADNEIKILLGNGFALGDISSHHKRENGKIHFADKTALAATFVFEYANGKTEELLTSENWGIYSSPVVYSDIYQGEICDYTRKPEFLANAENDRSPKPALIPFYGGSVRPRERFNAERLIISPKGEKIIDFGQNLAGFVEIKNTLLPGEKIKISHAEVLDKYGNFYNGNLQWAKAADEFVSDGKTPFLKPHFTYHGFRYIRIDELPERLADKIDESDFCAVALYTDMSPALQFDCPNENVNKFFKNVLWGQKSNFLCVPSDCPQRSERFGWTGDVTAFCQTACLNFDVKDFFSRWLKDVYLDQIKSGEDKGAVPCVIPAVFRGLISAGWGDVATVCPWEVYLAYGDKSLLRENYPLMKNWVEYIRSRAKKGGDEYMWTGDEHYGDWLAMDIAGELLGCTQTDLIAQAYYYKSALLCYKAARILKIESDETEYAALCEKVKNAFISAYLKDGLPVVYEKGDGDKNAPHGGVYARPVKNDTQTAVSIILNFGLCEKSDRKKLAKRLSELVKSAGHLTTGFLGTPELLFALSQNGYENLAYKLFLSEKMPSWLFPVTKGATTVWERWNGINENGDFENPDMNSFNHYAYGAAFSWVVRYVMGITPSEKGAGYKIININPHPNKRFPQANVVLKTPHGDVTVKFDAQNGKTRYFIEVPASVTARVRLKGVKNKIILGKKTGVTELDLTV